MLESPINSILKKYCEFENLEKTGLLLLDLPTGFGKTYEVLKYIYEVYTESNRKILFLTDLKKNLPHDTLLKRFFEEKNQLLEFEKDVVFINSNVDCVIENIPNLTTQIPEDIKETEEYKNLLNYLQFYTDLENKRNKQPLDITQAKKIKDEIRLDFEPKFRRLMSKKLFEASKKKEERVKLIKSDKRFSWIPLLYPAALSFEKRIFFLSVDKFLVKNTPIAYQAHYFFDNDFLENALIFIDEFDSSKKVVLNKIIKDNLKNRIDLIGLFEQIYSSFQSLNLPTSFRQTAKNTQKRGVKISEILDNLIKEAQRLNDAYNISFSIKTEGLEHKKNFLFHDFRYHTIVSGKKTFIHVEQDEGEQINKICFTEKNRHKVEKPSIFELLNALRRYINFFKGGAKLIAENYQELLNQRRKATEDKFSFENALRTFFNELKLTDEQQRYLIDKIQTRKFNAKQRSKNTQETNDLSFYSNGFRYYDFEDNESHQTKSKIYIADFDTSPEKIMLDLAKSNFVVGISATAKINTVLGNYDLDYLERNLGGQHYYKLSGQEKKQLQSIFAERTKNYVPIEAFFIDADKVKQNLRNFGFSKPTYNTLLTEIEKNENDYEQKRYLKIAKVFQEFTQKDDIQSFLCFLNAHPKHNKSSLELAVLESLFMAIIKTHKKEKHFLNDKGELDIESYYHVLDSGNFEEQKQKILDKLEVGQKLFVMTTYQTLGAGQNIQYSLHDFNRRIKEGKIKQIFSRGDKAGKKEKDFDAIYLDMPTHKIVNIKGKLRDIDVNKRIFQMESIYQKDRIFYDQLIYEIKRTFKAAYYKNRSFNLFYPKEILKSLYEIVDYRNFVAREVIQAIGRINRTNFKNEKIYIYADKKIAPCIKYFDTDAHFCLKEFEGLVEQAQVEEGQHSDMSDKYKIKIERKNLRCHDWINAKIRSNYWSESHIKDWEELRELVLKHPTISQAQYSSETFRRWQFIYLPMLDEQGQSVQAANRYFFTEKSDYKEVELHFSAQKGKEVSASNVFLPKLMSIPEIKGFFESNSYASDFQENEYMIAPQIFNNIYKGALGEVIGKYILERYVLMNKQQLQELSQNIFERFDFMLPDGVFIDFKFWRDTNAQGRKQQIDKIFKRKVPDIRSKGYEFQKIFIINLLADGRFDIVPSIDGQLIEVPYLIDLNTNQIDATIISKLGRLINL